MLLLESTHGKKPFIQNTHKWFRDEWFTIQKSVDQLAITNTSGGNGLYKKVKETAMMILDDTGSEENIHSYNSRWRNSVPHNTSTDNDDGVSMREDVLKTYSAFLSIFPAAENLDPSLECGKRVAYLRTIFNDVVPDNPDKSAQTSDGFKPLVRLMNFMHDHLPPDKEDSVWELPIKLQGGQNQ